MKQFLYILSLLTITLTQTHASVPEEDYPIQLHKDQTSFFSILPLDVAYLVSDCLSQVKIEEGFSKYLEEKTGVPLQPWSYKMKLMNLQSQLVSISPLETGDVFGYLGNLKWLRVLDLKGNELEFIPESIGNFTKLKELYLDQNKLITLPHSIGNLSELKILSLSNNFLVSLPKSIGKLFQLKQLRLFGNELMLDESDDPTQWGTKALSVRFYLLFSHKRKVMRSYAQASSSYLSDSLANLPKVYKEG